MASSDVQQQPAAAFMQPPAFAPEPQEQHDPDLTESTADALAIPDQDGDNEPSSPLHHHGQDQELKPLLPDMPNSEHPSGSDLEYLSNGKLADSGKAAADAPSEDDSASIGSDATALTLLPPDTGDTGRLGLPLAGKTLETVPEGSILETAAPSATLSPQAASAAPSPPPPVVWPSGAGHLGQPLSQLGSLIDVRSTQGNDILDELLANGQGQFMAATDVVPTDYVPVPPDGGYGWVVVFAAFMIFLCADGFCYAYGILLPSLQRRFHASKALMAFPSGIMVGMCGMSGPIVSGLVNRYGCRAVCVFGGGLYACAILMSSFITDIVTFIIFFSVFGGLGMGMVCLAALVAVGFYFERKRALATGIAVSGSGFGQLIFPPLTVRMLNAYGLQGTLLLVAALLLHCCAFGLLLRPLLPKKDLRKVHEAVVTAEQRLHAALDMISLGSSHSDEDDQISLLKVNQPRGEDISRQQSVSMATGVTDRPPTSPVRGLLGHHDKHRDPEDNPSWSRRSSWLSSVTDLLPQPKRSLTLHTRTAADSANDGSDRPMLRLPHPHGSGQQLAFDRKDLQKLARIRNAYSESQNESVAASPHNEEQHSMADGDTGEHDRLSHAPSHSTTATTNRQLSHTKRLQSTHASQGLSSHAGISRMASRRTIDQTGRTSLSQYAQSLSRMNSAHNGFQYATSVISLANINPEDFQRPLYRQDIFYSGSISNMPTYKQSNLNQNQFRQSMMSIPTTMVDYDEVGIVQPGPMLGEKRMVCLGGILVPASLVNVITEMVDVSMLRNPVMLILCLANVISMAGFYAPYLFLTSRAVQVGIDEGDAALLLSVVGLSNTVARIFIGWFADLQLIGSLRLTNLSLIGCGLLCLGLCLGTSYAYMLSFSLLFGFVVAALMSLTSIVLCDLVGISRLTNAFGLLSLFRGFAFMFGASLAGIVYDSTGSYDFTFIYAATLFLISGAVCVGIEILLAYKPSLRLSDVYDQPLLNAAGDPNAPAHAWFNGPGGARSVSMSKLPPLKEEDAPRAHHHAAKEGAADTGVLEALIEEEDSQLTEQSNSSLGRRIRRWVEQTPKTPGNVLSEASRVLQQISERSDETMGSDRNGGTPRRRQSKPSTDNSPAPQADNVQRSLRPTAAAANAAPLASPPVSPDAVQT